MALETKQPQGKILFKRTDIVTMKKDIKMLRELDLRKEQLKTLEPIAKNAPVEAQKQRIFALKSKAVETKDQAVSLGAKEEELEKQRWVAERNAVEAKKRLDELEKKNQEIGAQKAQLEQEAIQTNEVAIKASALAEAEKIQAPSASVKSAPVGEDAQRRKFMEDIEAWANADKK